MSGAPIPSHGSLEHWARQGVLLLNATLTVRARDAASHQRRGWEMFTDEVIRVVNAKPERVVFVLWGSSARKKRDFVDTSRHVVIESPHPSPLSAHRGFVGSCPFSQANEASGHRGSRSSGLGDSGARLTARLASSARETRPNRAERFSRNASRPSTASSVM